MVQSVCRENANPPGKYTVFRTLLLRQLVFHRRFLGVSNSRIFFILPLSTHLGLSGPIPITSTFPRQTYGFDSGTDWVSNPPRLCRPYLETAVTPQVSFCFFSLLVITTVLATLTQLPQSIYVPFSHLILVAFALQSFQPLVWPFLPHSRVSGSRKTPYFFLLKLVPIQSITGVGLVQDALFVLSW